MQKIRDRGPGLRPQEKVLKFISLHPAVFLGWKLCCKQEDCRRIYIHTGHLIGSEGQNNLSLWYLKLNGRIVQMVDRAR